MNEIQKAVTILNEGGIVIFPTDTAFGIGCRIDREESIQKLFTIRKRPETKATPVLVSSISMAKDYFKSITDEMKELMENYWPGALTIVSFANQEKIPSLVRGGSNTIGLRMPNHATVLEIITQIGVPLLGPSANFSGEATPFSQNELSSDLIRMVDFVVSGTCSLKQASTVVDCTVSPTTIIRQGAITLNL